MAAKSSVKPHGIHPHCKICDACLTTGSNYHPCRPEPIDPEVLEVFMLETRSMPARSRFAAFNGGGDRENGYMEKLTLQWGKRHAI